MKERTYEASLSALYNPHDAIREKLRADLEDLGRYISRCIRCPSGGGGIPGCGEPGSHVFMLAGRPGPEATPLNPWGRWKETFLRRVREEWGWNEKSFYFSTAVRCPIEKVDPAVLRRCSSYLCEELYISAPRLVVVSGKLAAVTLRATLGEEVPAKPRAGDLCSVSSLRFLFNLDVARIGEDEEAAVIFWDIIRRAPV